MTAIIEVAPSTIAVYEIGSREPIWALDLYTQNGKKEGRRLAAQILDYRLDALIFERNGERHKVPVGPGLAARIAEVSW